MAPLAPVPPRFMKQRTRRYEGVVQVAVAMFKRGVVCSALRHSIALRCVSLQRSHRRTDLCLRIW